jgi:hypothetical protein
MVVHANYPNFWGGRDKRIVVRGQPWQKHETLSENKKLKAKRTRAQVVQHLPNKSKTLS